MKRYLVYFECCKYLQIFAVGKIRRPDAVTGFADTS